MENTKITITPLALSYCLGDPHPHKNQLSALFKFKRILISTGYELEKFECKKTFPFPNNSTVNPSNPVNLDLRHYASQTSISFQLVREMELSNTKVDIIVIGLLNLGKDVNLLGIATLDLGIFEHTPLQHGQIRRQMKVALDKCDDPGAYLTIEVQLKDIERPKRIDNRRNRRDESMEQMGTLETEGYNRETMMLNRRKNQDFPTAYEISHRNYKQVQITREEYYVSDKSKDKLAGSYKKRFQYQAEYDQQQGTTSRVTKKSTVIKDYTKIGKTPRGNQSFKRDSPAPRLKTPEPINEVRTDRGNPTRPKISHKPKQDSYSHAIRPTKNDSVSRSHVTERPTYKEPKSSRSEQEQNWRKEQQKHRSPPENSNDEDSRYKHVESTPNMEMVKDNKFRMITEKLQKIEKRIMGGNANKAKERERTFSDERYDEDSNQDVLALQDDDVVQQPKVPRPFNQSANPSSQGEGSKQNVFESSVAHFSPSDSRKQIKNTDEKSDIKNTGTFKRPDEIKPNKQLNAPAEDKKRNQYVSESPSIKITPNNSKKPSEKQNKEDDVKPSPTVVKPNPQAVKPSPQVVKPNPQAVKPSPEVVKPRPQVISEPKQQVDGQNNKQKKQDPQSELNRSPSRNNQGKSDLPQQNRSPIKQLETDDKPNLSQKQQSERQQLPNKQTGLTNKKQSSNQDKQKPTHRFTFNENSQVEPTEPKQDGKPSPNNQIHQADHKECENKINALEVELQEQEQNYRKGLLEKQLDYKNKVKEEQEKVGDKLKQLNELRNEVIKQKNLIDKLNIMYEESDDKNFEMAKQYEKKCMEYERKLDALIKKNGSLVESLQEKDQEIKKCREQIETLTTELNEAKRALSEMSKLPKEQQQQDSSSSKNGSQQRISPSEVSSGNKEPSPSPQQKVENFKDEYLTQKKRVVNLESEVRLRQNQIRFLKIKNETLTQQKRDLENEIDMIAANNKLEMAKQGSVSKMNLESQSVTNSVRNENRALKEEINNLQVQVHELNDILEDIIAKDTLSKSRLMRKDKERRKGHEQSNDAVMYKKYKALEQKAAAYQSQLMKKQSRIAEILNIVWSYGNRELMDQIDKLVANG